MQIIGGNQPLYDPAAVQPMRDELTCVGIQELRTSDEVDEVIGARDGTALVVVNSVCGCAAGGARPGAMLSLQNKVIPDKFTTVFAGMDREATERARSYMRAYQPSSPSIALFKDGEVVFMLQRHDIEGRHPLEIAEALAKAYDTHCSRTGPSIPREEFEKIIPIQRCGSQVPRFGE